MELDRQRTYLTHFWTNSHTVQKKNSSQEKTEMSKYLCLIRILVSEGFKITFSGNLEFRNLDLCMRFRMTLNSPMNFLAKKCRVLSIRRRAATINKTQLYALTGIPSPFSSQRGLFWLFVANSLAKLNPAVTAPKPRGTEGRRGERRRKRKKRRERNRKLKRRGGKIRMTERKEKEKEEEGRRREGG